MTLTPTSTQTDAIARYAATRRLGVLVPVKSTLSLLVPKRIYTYWNDKNTTRQSSLEIFIDQLVNDPNFVPDPYFALTGTNKINVASPLNAAIKSSTILSFNIKGGNFYSDAVISLIQKNTIASRNQNKKVILECLGDSLTEGAGATVNVPAGGPFHYAGMVAEAFMKLQIDSADNAALFQILLSGTINKGTWQMSYGSIVNRTMRACNEGRGGWTLFAYVHYSRNWTFGNTRALRQGLFDLLGLGDGSGTDYSFGNATQDYQIMTTPEGKNISKNTSQFLDYVNSQLATAYTTYAQALAAVQAKQQTPENPFYDYDLASTTNSIRAYSRTKYIARYQTLSRDGSTRLVVGSTAGNLVTNATAYDVTVPTHIYIQLSVNDGAYPAAIAYNYDILSAGIQSDYASNSWGAVNIGISINTVQGTYYPLQYPEYDYKTTARINDTANRHDNQYKTFAAVLAALYSTDANEDTTRIFIMPTIAITPPADGTQTTDANSPGYAYTGLQRMQYKIGKEFLHPNGIKYRIDAESITGWILYTLGI